MRTAILALCVALLASTGSLALASARIRFRGVAAK